MTGARSEATIAAAPPPELNFTHDDAPRDPDPGDGVGHVEERFRSLMEGLRTTLPGVQMLMAFLLILPLQAGFADLDALQRNTYVVAFASAAVASVLLIAPSVHQRVRAPESGLARRSPRHLRSAVRTTITGTVFMAVAFAASAMLVVDLVLGTRAATVGAGAIGLLMGWSWFLQPLLWRHRD